MQEGDEDPAPAGSDRVAERAAMGLDAFRLDAQFPEHGERLCGDASLRSNGCLCSFRALELLAHITRIAADPSLIREELPARCALDSRG